MPPRNEASYIRTRAELQYLIDDQVNTSQRQLVRRIDIVLAKLREPGLTKEYRALGARTLRSLYEDLEYANERIVALRAELVERERAVAEFEERERRERRDHEERVRRQRVAEEREVELRRRRRVEAEHAAATRRAADIVPIAVWIEETFPDTMAWLSFKKPE
ncbi:unnamed protein product [Zymoseptoria tritici ST99CH_1E4]|uniref:Uncharacterized protein n=1 Tax=Zymoseptoria tritici ST99CH_1E4 TaxID=1276532 RepID=A0A2H1GNA3_ZYMTR|nr:unnamed protein product [Zymoseptoria tritici ST99CH_1E4]